jgi:hypothetical protein
VAGTHQAGFFVSTEDWYPSHHAVYWVDETGWMTRMAGTTPGYGGDFGPGTDAELYIPRGLAVDASAGVLYIADAGNSCVRAVDLATGLITTVAGGGAIGSPTYGDGGVATAAQLARLGRIQLGPDGLLCIADSNRGIRVLDPRHRRRELRRRHDGGGRGAAHPDGARDAAQRADRPERRRVRRSGGGGLRRGLRLRAAISGEPLL